MPRTAHALLACGSLLACGVVHGQARGPSAEEVHEHGQKVGKEEVLDDTARARKLAELNDWLHRLTGRFRIDGEVEFPGGPPNGEGMQGGRVRGIADCIGIGDGPGVHCMINATWPIFADPLPTTSDLLNAMQPAVLTIGLNLDPPGIQSLLVTDDSITQFWVGKLQENTAKSSRQTRCFDRRCMWTFEIISRPTSEIVTFVFHFFTGSITFIMHRDPNANADEAKKAR